MKRVAIVLAAVGLDDAWHRHGRLPTYLNNRRPSRSSAS